VSYSVSEVAGLTGLTAHTLRWYERVGLLDAVSRDTVGRRRYGEADLTRLRFLIRLRATGMPVRDMIRYVDLVRAGPATVADRVALLAAHRERVLEQIEALREDLKIIDYKIDNYREVMR
jgi:DNA-binding transcriptional MerR regulator